MEDETDITEIAIQPDGRVYVFGASRGILDVLAVLCPEDLKLRLLLDAIRNPHPAPRLPGNEDSRYYHATPQS